MVLVAFSLSLSAGVVGVLYYPSATFFLVPTRAWELLAGSVLAIGCLPSPHGNLQKNLAGFLGLLLVGASIALYTESTPFPGMAALMPVTGSGLIIWSGMGGGLCSKETPCCAPPGLRRTDFLFALPLALAACCLLEVCNPSSMEWL